MLLVITLNTAAALFLVYAHLRPRHPGFDALAARRVIGACQESPDDAAVEVSHEDAEALYAMMGARRPAA